MVVSAVSAAAPIGEGADMIAFLLQQHADGSQDVLVVVNEGDIRHKIRSKLGQGQYKPMINKAKSKKFPMTVPHDPHRFAQHGGLL